MTQQNNLNNITGLNATQIEIMQNLEKQSAEKEQKFKERIAAFKDITTLEEARALAKKILPVAQEVNKFRIGNAKCIVLNKEEQLRICFDSGEEFIAYDFA